MRCVLPPDLPFDALEARLAADGWQRQPIPGLLPPLRTGEPEQARFTWSGKTVLYSFNPVVDLRVLDGDVDSRMPRVEPETVTAWLVSGDDLAVARGCLAAAELGLRYLRAAVLDAAARLPDALRPMGQAALQRLSPLPAGRPTGAFEVLPAGMKRQVLRHALADRPSAAADLVQHCWSDGPELAATAMIAAARLNLRDQGLAVRRADVRCLGRTRRETEVFVALQKACLATLEGQRPSDAQTPKDAFWRAVLESTAPRDDVTLLIHALVAPLPDVASATPSEGFCIVADVPHWLGHSTGRGLPNPVRRWCPEAPLQITAAAQEAVGADGIAAALSRLANGQLLRLPSIAEWEALMRGPDGRPYPWGVDPELPSLPISPWGAHWSGQPEWANLDGTPVLCGSDPSGRVSYLRAADAGSTAAIRGVIPVRV